MHQFNIFLLCLVLFVYMALISGCASQKEMNPSHRLKEAYVLDYVGSHPQSPAALKKGQRLNVEVFYSIPENEMVHIWARPYWKGQLSSGYQAHPLIPVGGQKPTAGIQEMWFLFEEPAAIDEIRVMMKEFRTDRVIKMISQPVEIRWQE